MNNLNAQLTALEAKISKQAIFNSTISKSNVGWHIEHILLVVNKIIEDAEKSNPLNYKSKFSLLKILIFATNKIPRGKAKVPEVVAPIKYDEITLQEHLNITKSKIQDLEMMDSNKYFNHPFFGNLKLQKTIKFIEIHNNHHLKIINDILKEN